MAYSTISKPSLHFNTKLYSGNGGTQSVTGVGFQPDWVWLKRRDAAAGHKLNDAVRGVNKQLVSNNTNAQNTDTNVLTAFGTDGFTLGNNSDVNNGSGTFASWNWKAGGSGSANTDGSINTTVSVNTTAGFSIVKWTGTNSSGTIGHGLGTTPSVFISKSMAGNHAWGVYHKSIGIGSSTLLNSSNAPDPDSNYYGGTSPTSTIMGLGNSNYTNASGDMIGYAFTEKKGYSKFGSYTGNGSTEGTFVYTGFKPAFLIWKQTNTGGQNWGLFDNKRDPHNFVSLRLPPDTNDSEGSPSAAGSCDFLSNGFKWRSDFGSRNGNNGTYIYMVFAEEPLVANVGASIPATAR